MEGRKSGNNLVRSYVDSFANLRSRKAMEKKAQKLQRV